MFYDIHMMVETIFHLEKINKFLRNVAEVGGIGARTRQEITTRVMTYFFATCRWVLTYFSMHML
jgi:hypothetical protein